MAGLNIPPPPILTVWHYLQHQPFSAIDDTMTNMTKEQMEHTINNHHLFILNDQVVFKQWIRPKDRALKSCENSSDEKTT